MAGQGDEADSGDDIAEPRRARPHAERIEERRLRLREQRVPLALLRRAAAAGAAAHARRHPGERTPPASAPTRPPAVAVIPKRSSTSGSRQPARSGTLRSSTHQKTKNTTL